MLEDRVISTIRNNMEEVEDVKIDSDLEADLGIDSFGVLMIINGIEDEFNITIDEGHILKTRTVGEIVSVLKDVYGIKE